MSWLYDMKHKIFVQSLQTQYLETAREIGLVDYWKEFGWPDLCRPVGEDDFECD